MIKKRKVRPQKSTMKPWDDRHHLSDSQNELLGRELNLVLFVRTGEHAYFSKAWAREF